MVLNMKSQVKAHLLYKAPTPSSQLALYHRILYLAPPIPGGLHWSPGEQCGLQVDSTWNVLN